MRNGQRGPNSVDSNPEYYDALTSTSGGASSVGEAGHSIGSEPSRLYEGCISSIRLAAYRRRSPVVHRRPQAVLVLRILQYHLRSWSRLCPASQSGSHPPETSL